MKHKNNLTSYHHRLQSVLAVITLIIVASAVIGTLFQLIRAFMQGADDGSSAQLGIPGLFFTCIPLITVGGGFAVGLLTTIGQTLSRPERIIRSGTLSVFCNLLYVPLFSLVLLLSFRAFGFVAWLTVIAPFIALGLTAVFAIIVRLARARGNRVLMVGFSIIVIASMIEILIQDGRYEVWIAAFLILPVAAAGLVYRLQLPIGRLVRLFYALYIISLIVFGSMSASYFALDSSFASTSVTEVMSIVVAIGLLAVSLYTLIRLRITYKR